MIVLGHMTILGKIIRREQSVPVVPVGAHTIRQRVHLFMYHLPVPPTLPNGASKERQIT